MNHTTEQGETSLECTSAVVARKHLRQKLSEEQKELEQMQLERLRRQGPDRAWRSRRQVFVVKDPSSA